jgi:hypothetical protein
MSPTRRIARDVGSIAPGFLLGRVSGDYGPIEILNRTGAVRSANVTPRYTGVMGGGFDDRLSWNGLAPLNSYISGRG